MKEAFYWFNFVICFFIYIIHVLYTIHVVCISLLTYITIFLAVRNDAHWLNLRHHNYDKFSKKCLNLSPGGIDGTPRGIGEDFF